MASTRRTRCGRGVVWRGAVLVAGILMRPRSPPHRRGASHCGGNRLPRKWVVGARTACDAGPVRGSGRPAWGAVAHVFLAVALCLPLVAAAVMVGVSMAARDASELDVIL